MRRAIRIATLVSCGLLLIAAGAYCYLKFATHGFSARAQPSAMETTTAEYAGDTAMPGSSVHLGSHTKFVVTHLSPR